MLCSRSMITHGDRGKVAAGVQREGIWRPRIADIIGRIRVAVWIYSGSDLS